MTYIQSFISIIKNLLGYDGNEELDIDLFARVLYGEARGEPDEGKIAIANVVMNRVNNPCWWGKDLYSVLKKPYQFSCLNDNDPNLPIIMSVTEDNPVFDRCLDIAKQAFSNKLPDITKGANSYYAKSIAAPKWTVGLTPTAEIGNHIFYNMHS